MTEIDIQSDILSALGTIGRACDFGELDRRVRDGREWNISALAVREAAWDLIQDGRAQLATGFKIELSRPT